MSVNCIHWFNGPRGSACRAGHYAGLPSPMLCMTKCPHRKPATPEKPGETWTNPWTKVVKATPGQRFITDAQKSLANERRAVCGGCEHQKSMTDLTVSCGACGCGGVPLYAEAKRCPKGKWKEAERPSVIVPKLGDIGFKPDRLPLAFYIHGETPTYLQDLYRGRSAFLVCGGPSFGSLDHAKLKHHGILTMGVNNSVKTFRPNLWTHVDQADHFIRSIFLDPTITKFSPMNIAGGQVFDGDAWKWTPYRIKDCPNVFFYKRNATFNADTYLTEPTINWGNDKDHGGARSVMLVAIRILYELGVRRVFLLGADFNMSTSQKYHFDQDRAKGSINGNNYTYRVLQERFAKLRPIFEANGFHVYNCNYQSKLTVFDHVPYDEAVKLAMAEFGPIDLANERTSGLYDTEKPKVRVSDVAKPQSVASSRSDQYDLTIITPTGDRPEAFALCERWMAKQTFTGKVQWVVVDDGGVPTKVTLQKDGWDVKYVRRDRVKSDPPHTLPVQLESGLRSAQSERIAVVEDDDWYHESYLSLMHGWLDNSVIAGVSHAIYYLVWNPRWKCLNNRGHASLAATGFRGPDAMRVLQEACSVIRKPYVDLHCWRNTPGPRYLHPYSVRQKPLVVQMKGMIGRAGIGRHHVSPEARYRPDPDMKQLESWIGDDATHYRRYIRAEVARKLGARSHSSVPDRQQGQDVVADTGDRIANARPASVVDGDS